MYYKYTCGLAWHTDAYDWLGHVTCLDGCPDIFVVTTTTIAQRIQVTGCCYSVQGYFRRCHLLPLTWRVTQPPPTSVHVIPGLINLIIVLRNTQLWRPLINRPLSGRPLGINCVYLLPLSLRNMFSWLPGCCLIACLHELRAVISTIWRHKHRVICIQIGKRLRRTPVNSLNWNA